MKFLKVLSNSVLSGVFFSLLLALLISNLNINLRPSSSFFVHLGLFLMLSYGLLITFLCLLIFYILHFFLGKENKTGFFSPPFLMISFSALILLFLLVFRQNYLYFFSFFDPRLQSLLRTQMIVLVGLSLAGFFFAYGYRRRRKRLLLAGGYLILFTVLLAFTFSLRIKYPFPPKNYKLGSFETKRVTKKILIIGLEGLSFDFIIPLNSQGKLANFSWLMEGGCWGRLENFTPNDPFILINSFNTGKLPAKHRQISNIHYQLPLIQEMIEIVPRFIFFRQLTRTGLLKIVPHRPSQTPVDIWKILSTNSMTILKKDKPDGQGPLKPSQKTATLFNLLFKDFRRETLPVLIEMKQAFFHDCEYEEKAFLEKNTLQPQLFYLFLNGLNTTETFFYKYSFPDTFGTIRQEEIDKYGTVIERYYGFYDQIIGKYLTSLKEDELLVIFSPHGIEPLPLWKRFVEWLLGNAAVSSYHEFAPDGAIFFYGKGIQKGKNIEGMRLVDIAPTLLYYLGLPVAKDMDGIVQSSLFAEEFTTENPIFYISSYEESQTEKSK